MPSSTARPAASASRVRGVAPIPTTTRSASIRLPSAVSTASTAPLLPWNATTRWPGTIRTPCSAWASPVDRSDLGAEHPLERDGGGDHVGHLAAELAERRRHLRADPALADHHDPARLGGGLAKRVRVVDRAQEPDPGEIGAGHLEPPRLGAGRQEQAVEADPPTVAQHDLPRGRIDGVDGRRGLELHPLLRVPAPRGGRRPSRARPRRAGTPSTAAGGGTAGAPRCRTATTRPSNPSLRRRLRRLGAGQACADDEDGPGLGHGRPPRVSVERSMVMRQASSGSSGSAPRRP